MIAFDAMLALLVTNWLICYFIISVHTTSKVQCILQKLHSSLWQK